MKTTLIFLITLPPILFMNDCFEIKTVDLIEKNILQKENIDLLDFDVQLKTNSAFLYTLKDKRVILLPNPLIGELDGIIFKNHDCFKKFEEADKFPVENPNKNIYEESINELLSLPDYIDSFRVSLNEKTGFEFSKITKESIEKYYKFLSKGRKKKLKLLDTFIPMGVLIGEIIRKEKNAKWGLLKYYEMYNPYYEPILIDSEGGIYRVHGAYQNFIENVGDLNFIYKRIEVFGGNQNINGYLEHKGSEYVKIFE